ncbi:hypothetical protein C0993_008962 [Termitomyces sp. T159_Od127]|nr:hypothetical protein C0993_008962 [Termitomyces sp. T159_Od127]
MASTAIGAAMPAARKAPVGGAKGLASSAKKESSTKPASKRRGHQAPRYEEHPRPYSGEDILLGGAGEKGAGGSGEDDKKKESSKSKHKASPPLSPADKGKKRARVVSLVAVTPEVESEGDKEDEACCFGEAIETSKAALRGEDLVGPTCQAEAPQNVGDQQEDMEQEEEAEVRLEVAPLAQLWGWELPQWS